MKYLFIIGILTIGSIWRQTQIDWKIKRDEKGVKVFTISKSGSTFHQVMVETQFKNEPSNIVQGILKVQDYTKWIYQCSNSQLISKVNDTVFIYRHVTDAPWPIEDRDHISKVTVSRLPKGMISITSKMVFGYPEYPDCIRLKHTESTWHLTPMANGGTLLNYQLSFDPGGTVPTWLVDIFIADGPYNTFINLKKYLAE